MEPREKLLHGAPAVAIVEYQPGAVVSHTVAKSPNGSVTVFAFDEGQELSEHTAPHDATILILDGEAEIRVSGVAHPLKAGDILLMPADAPHAVKATRRFKMLLAMVR